jgi:hypothetical protein
MNLWQVNSQGHRAADILVLGSSVVVVLAWSRMYSLSAA